MTRYEVSLKTQGGVRFPKRCIYCDAPNPNSSAHTAVPTGVVGDKILTLNVRVPCCKKCWLPFSLKFAMHSQIFLTLGGPAFFIPFALGLAYLYERPYGMAITGTVATVCGIIGLVVAWNWQVAHPAPFYFGEVDSASRLVEFSFTSKVYATEFSTLNNQPIPAAWKYT